MLEYAGLNDCYTSSRGSTKTLGNFVKATFFCIRKLYAPLAVQGFRDWALPAPTSAPGLGSPSHICAGTGLSPLPHLRRDCPL